MRTYRAGRLIRRTRERGVVLIIALIALVAMTLAAIGLMRSTDTANIIAGNLAFKQNAVHAGDVGIETARAWLIANAAGATLYANVSGSGYYAAREDPASWTTYFASANLPTAFSDSVGNTITYVVHRLCSTAGNPNDPSVQCSASAASVTGTSPGNSRAAGRVSVTANIPLYYRITVKVAAPRNTTTYVQSVVVL